MKILLVEDHDLNRDMLARRLTRRGFDMVVAATGEEGVRLAQIEQPAVVLMDLSLPGIDGFEAARRLRAEAGTSSMRLIALTAHAFDRDRQAALAAGFDDFDTKPVDLERLIGKVMTMVGAAR